MSPADLVELADHLVVQADADALPRDASFRTAIGRLYYAVFLAARETLEHTGAGRPNRSDQAHRWVADQFGGADPQCVSIRRDLTTLRGWRNQADYNDPRLDAEAMCAATRTTAVRALRSLEAYRRRHGV